ncbi:MAG: DUF1919 domain-containing protein [Sulfuricurvum sp.]|nr:DUF1919 domain-containing protein [Sulfuricurvum sp.]
MRIKFIRDIEKKIKGSINRLILRQTNFSIISNNCWGTFIYKKFNLQYHSPFVNLFIFSEDYLELLENFTPQLIESIRFIEHKNSKYIDRLKEQGLFGQPYPIGVIGDAIEVHFQHYKDKEDAKRKWEDRVKRINYNKLLFKFSDSLTASDDMIRQFDKLPYKNKICFTAKPFSDCESVIHLPKFFAIGKVRDEWKHSEKEYNLSALLNTL